MSISELSKNDRNPVFVIIMSGILVAFAAFIPMEEKLFHCKKRLHQDSNNNLLSLVRAKAQVYLNKKAVKSVCL